MDKRLFDKSSNFFKKEGFYVILFVCLCIVATVAAVSARNNKAKDSKPPVVQEQQDKATSDVALNSGNEAKTDIPNALEVKNNQNPSAAISVPKNGSAATVSKTVDNKFAKPVDGTLATTYTTETVYCQTIGTYKTDHGIEIQAKLGSSVFAALDGKVETVDNDKTELGQYIVINHQNGLKTVYANLNAKVNVKVGDTVKKGTVIGTVGNTRESFSDEKYGSHLHFEVMSGKEYVDPAKYVTYNKIANQ
jgi:murein DD-endopeptidase MepM/ murein hydrolase activator NlpD